MMKSIPVSGLERADVATLAADDASLEVVRLERDHGHGRLHRVTGGHPLHDGGEDVAGAPVRLALGLLLDLAHEPCAVVAKRIFQLLQQDLPRLARAQPRHALELAHMLLLGGLQLLGVAAPGSGRGPRATAPCASCSASRRSSASCLLSRRSSMRAISARRAPSPGLDGVRLRLPPARPAAPRGRSPAVRRAPAAGAATEAERHHRSGHDRCNHCRQHDLHLLGVLHSGAVGAGLRGYRSSGASRFRKTPSVLSSGIARVASALRARLRTLRAILRARPLVVWKVAEIHLSQEGFVTRAKKA